MLNLRKWVFLFLFLTLSLSTVLAGNDTDTMTVDVNVYGTTVINIMQNSLAWNNVETGTEGSMEVIDVKNVGSKDVTGIYGYVDTLEHETTNPTGTSDPNLYSAGSVLTFRVNKTGEDFWFAGRLEWNYTDSIELISLPTGAVSSGWFHNTSYEYVWGMVNGTPLNDTGAGGCNSTGTIFRINKYNDNGTTITRDLNTNSNYYVQDATPDSTVRDWAIFSFNEGPLAGYCVATYVNCTKLYIYKYDRRPSGSTQFVGCDNIAYLNTTDKLAPGYVQKINLNVRIPYGIPTGNLHQTVLTIFASDYY